MHMDIDPLDSPVRHLGLPGWRHTNRPEHLPARSDGLPAPPGRRPRRSSASVPCTTASAAATPSLLATVTWTGAWFESPGGETGSTSWTSTSTRTLGEIVQLQPTYELAGGCQLSAGP